jgi:hypothetical protein
MGVHVPRRDDPSGQREDVGVRPHHRAAHADVGDASAGDGDIRRVQLAAVHVEERGSFEVAVREPAARRDVQQPPAFFRGPCRAFQGTVPIVGVR